MPEPNGEQTAAELHREGVNRVWFCFSLSPEARLGLGPQVLSLTGTPEGDLKAYAELLAEAGDGNALAMYEAGLLAIVGCGTPQDVDSGCILLDEAIDAGLPDAMYAKGDLFARGTHVPVDLAEAIACFRLAAAQHFSDAAGRIDELFAELTRLRAEAVHGDAEAQYRVGVMMWRGNALPLDSEKGLEWLRASAEQGHREAKECLEFLEVTLPTLRAHAEAGEPDAQFELARQHLLDDALPQDLPLAMEWLKRAARQGHQEACAFLGAATTWQNGDSVLEDLLAQAADGEDWAVEALKHRPHLPQ